MSEDNTIFDGSKQKKSKKRPVLENNGEGVAAWLHTDKNNNAYFSVSLPLGLGSLALFPCNDEMRDALNQLKKYLDEQGSEEDGE